MTDSPLRRGYFIFFTVLVVFAIIVLAISAWLTARYGSNYPFTTERDRVHFLLFLLYLDNATFPYISHAIAFGTGRSSDEHCCSCYLLVPVMGVLALRCSCHHGLS